MKQKKSLLLFLTEKQKSSLRNLADADGCTMTNWIRSIIKTEFEKLKEIERVQNG